jgi:hypothetical protein
VLDLLGVPVCHELTLPAVVKVQETRELYIKNKPKDQQNIIIYTLLESANVQWGQL